MAITNRDRVGSAMDTLKAGLAPFVVAGVHQASQEARPNQVLQQILGEPVAGPEEAILTTWMPRRS